MIEMNPREVIVLFGADSDARALVIEGASLALAQRCCLELIAVVSPFFVMLMESGWSYAPFEPDELDRELSMRLVQLVSAVPDNVSVRSRAICAGRRQVRREVEARNPTFLLADRRFRRLTRFGQPVPSPLTLPGLATGLGQADTRDA